MLGDATSTVQSSVSSAYLQKPIARDSMTKPIIATISVNRMGPSTHTCEAPIIIEAHVRQECRRRCILVGTTEVLNINKEQLVWNRVVSNRRAAIDSQQVTTANWQS